jgi:hypothetical protein
VDIPNYRTIPIILNRDDWYMNHPPQHLNYFTPTTIASLLSKAGFAMEELYTEGAEIACHAGRQIFSL